MLSGHAHGPNVEQSALKIEPVTIPKCQYQIRNMDISEKINNIILYILFIFSVAA